MKITVLGSGTSTGVPITACSCPVCLSDDPYNKRTRSSILVEEGGLVFLVDSSPDLRFQLLRESVGSLDGVFYTHSHADHLHGIDDLRPYTHKKKLPLYGSPGILKEIEERFPYIFEKTRQAGGGKPELSLCPLSESREFGTLRVTPLPVFHGAIPIYGYRFNDFVYVTDCSRIPGDTMALMAGCRFMIIGGLRYRTHETHFSINQALDIIKKTGPERAWLTHICHDVDHGTLCEELPSGTAPAFDGLKVFI